MRSRLRPAPLAAVLALAALALPTFGAPPPPGDAWRPVDPRDAGLDLVLLGQAVHFARTHETEMPTDLEQGLRARLEGKPHNAIIGPMKPRGAPNGLVLYRGQIVAEWGDTRRADMAFSVSKSLLATLAGIAYDRGLLRLDEPVSATVDDGGFDPPHNAVITWRHLFQQTSEWQGRLWGKPDAADRRRGFDRELQAPGSFWEYNDVRVNRASLALLRLFDKPLPDVLRREIFEPLGASSSWEWHGYDSPGDATSIVELSDGRRALSVSGGGHWGGGLWISSRDLARYGLLHLNRGTWGERRLVSEGWLDAMTTPTPIKPSYGLLWWLNTDRELWPSAPESSYAARGGGGNLVWIDPENELVAVVRWLERDAEDAFLSRLLAAVPGAQKAAGETRFTDVTSLHLPPQVDGPTMDAALGDVDGDGDLDILLAQEHRPNLLLLQIGGGHFKNASHQLPTAAHDSEDIALADFDGDGDLDAVLVSEDDEIDEIYLNDGRGRFRDGRAEDPSRLPPTGHSNAVVAVDLDGDGDLDLVIGNKGQNRVLLNDGTARFTEATHTHLPALEDTTQDLELGDVDGDGDLDLLVANEDRNRLLLNEGHGVFLDVTEAQLPTRAAPEETREAELGDVDGDGDLDIVFANIRGFVADADPANRLLLNDGRGFFTDVTAERLPADTDRSFDAELVDADGDGDLDLITSNAERRGREVLETPWRVYRNNGTGRFTEATAEILPPGVLGRGFDAEAGDLNGDGKLDFYLSSRGSSDRLLLGK